MGAKSIKFEGFELQNADKYLIRDIRHRMMPERDVIQFTNPRRSSISIVDAYFTEKRIEVEGLAIANNKEQLKNNIDDLKRILQKKEGNLDIQYGEEDDYRRYKATLVGMRVPEEFYHITRLPFSLTFVSRPYATVIESETQTKTIVSGTFEDSIDVGGSFGPFPIISWEVASGTVTSLKFTNEETGDWIEFDDISLSVNDKIEVDCEERTVYLNEDAKDFKGVFPKFVPRSNEYKIEIAGSDFSVLQEIEYFETFV